MSSGDKRRPLHPRRSGAEGEPRRETKPAAPAPPATSHARDNAPTHGTSAGVPLFLQRKDGGGAALDASTKERMEERLGESLDDVRVHTGDAASQSAKSIGARAYTIDRDVVFGAGEYAPGTTGGDELLAHELTHVAQQARRAGGDAPVLSGADDAHERAATRAAARTSRHGAADAARSESVSAAPVPVVQRAPLPGAVPSPLPDMRLRPPPMLARSMGSLTIDGFAHNGSDLGATHKKQLASLATTIVDLVRDYPGGTLTLVGHADLTGEARPNEELGQERADAALAELASNGVPREMMRATSAGESAPLVATRSKEPRNRRVEITFEPEMRFHLVEPSELTLRGPEPFTPPPPPPQLDPRKILTPPTKPETLEEKLNRIIKEAPPPPKGKGKSLGQAVRDKLDEGVNNVMERFGVPKSVRPYIRDAARKAAEKAADAVLDEVMNAAGIDPAAKEAIKKAVEAAVETPAP